MRLGRIEAGQGETRVVNKDKEPASDLNWRDLARDASWRPLFLWAAALWLSSALMGLFLGNKLVMTFQPWFWLALPVLAVPVLTLSWLGRPGAPERPWPRWVLWLLAASALMIAGYLGLAAWLSWQQQLPWQALRYVLLALAVLPVSLMVRKLAQLQAQSFSDKDKQ